MDNVSNMLANNRFWSVKNTFDMMCIINSNICVIYADLSKKIRKETMQGY